MNVTVQDILNSLFNPSEEVCFRVIDDKKDGTFAGANLSCECANYSSIEGTLKEHNAQNRGIFFGANYGGHDDKSITRINAQFVEMDWGSFEEQQQMIDGFSIPPSMIIRTRKSLHVYWFMDGSAKVEEFRHVQKQLVKHFNGDPRCVNESRALRLPGFYHCKDDPVEVTCISFHPERRYTQEQLSDALPEVEDIRIEKKSGTDKGLYTVTHTCNFLKHCTSDAASLSEPEWYAMITNLAPFEGGTELIHKLSAPYPGYNEAATQKKINHFLDSGTKPMTCKTICENGYKCPRFDTGECQVRSPAALCYRSLRSDVLIKIIHTLPVTGNLLDDLQTAKKFISDCLYNQDAVTATAIINTELKGHFNLKADCLRPLTAVYKDLNKSYKTNQNAGMAGTGNALPPWYEPTDKGVRFLPGVLAREMAENEHVIYAAEQYFVYRDGVYQEMSEMEAQSMVQEKMLAKEMKMSQITDAEKQWRLRIQHDIRELNPNPYIINVKNGLYNVLEDTLTAHTPEYYSTVQLNVSYNKDADCPLFKKFLVESMDGDMEQVKLIQEILGYLLIPVTSAQKCFIFVGVAAAGKSVLLRVITNILGEENVSNISWQALNERFKPAELFGKQANIFADLPTKNIDDNGIFKALVGEDYLTVEKKNKDPFSFQCTARLLFSCNSIPKNYGDQSEGFYRRLIIIRFNRTVPENQRDPELVKKFETEADGIFLFALEGLRRLIANKYRFSETQVNADELQQYRDDSNSVRSFVKENCQLFPDGDESVGSTELYNAYKEYCEECGMRPCGHIPFVTMLETEYGVERDRDTLGRRRILIGIRRKDSPD